MIKYTEYLLPDGRKRDKFVGAYPSVNEKHEALVDRGVEFTYEILRTGEIAISTVKGEETICIDVFQDEALVFLKTENLVTRTYRRVFDESTTQSDIRPSRKNKTRSL